MQSVSESEKPDFPVAGPRTVGWVTRFLGRRGTAPDDHHRWWRSTARLTGAGWAVAEHQQCCRYLALAGSYDQLDITNLACLEAVARRLQTIEFQYKKRVKDHERGAGGSTAALAGQVLISLDEMDLFEGGGHVSTTVCCSPLLIEHVSHELEKEACIHKEARKAREQRSLPRSEPSSGEGVAKKKWRCYGLSEPASQTRAGGQRPPPPARQR